MPSASARRTFTVRQNAVPLYSSLIAAVLRDMRPVGIGLDYHEIFECHSLILVSTSLK